MGHVGLSPASGSVDVDPASVAPLMPSLPTDAMPTRRDLLLQALLHLPRIASTDGRVGVGEAVVEIDRLRALRSGDLAPVRWMAVSPPGDPALPTLKVSVIGREVAAPVLERFHYLRSPRSDAVTVAALAGDRIAALCSFSPLDLDVLGERLPLASPQQALVVSRVFAFDWAPRNIVSYLLARAEQLVAHDGVHMLITYVNPNLGFTGASYRAANWLPLGIETGTRYAYLSGRYVTDRRLVQLDAAERASVEYSKMRLEPLQLMCRLLSKRLRREYPEGFSFVLPRPA